MWVILSLIAAFCFAGLFTSFKYLELAGVPSIVTLVYVFIIGTLLNVVHLIFAGHSIAIGKTSFLVCILGALCCYLGNLTELKALSIAPNPGYAIAVASCQAIIFTIAAVFVFGSEFTWLKALGVVLSVLGVTIVSL